MTDTAANAIDSSLCPGCGAPNQCAISAGLPAADCWCMAAPRGLPLPAAAASCWCPRCLQQLTRDALSGAPPTPDQ